METGVSAARRGTAAGPRRTAATRLLGMLALSKIAVYQHYYGWALAWLLAGPAATRRAGSTTAMLFFLVGSAAIVASACAADDITGYRNGSDAINYQAGQRQRKISKKPLLTGAVTPGEALGFAIGAGLVAVLAGLAAFWSLRWQVPAASCVCYAAGGLLGVQYSAGLRLSYYRGGAEVLLCAATACGLLAPYLAITGDWSRPALTVALLLGLWLVMVSSYSNVNDRKGDGAAGRKTLAVSAGPGVFRTVMVLLVLASAGLICALALGMDWPRWTLLTMLPATTIHASQLYFGPVRKRWLTARRLGLLAYDAGFLGLLGPALALLLTR